MINNKANLKNILIDLINYGSIITTKDDSVGYGVSEGTFFKYIYQKNTDEVIVAEVEEAFVFSEVENYIENIPESELNEEIAYWEMLKEIYTAEENIVPMTQVM